MAPCAHALDDVISFEAVPKYFCKHQMVQHLMQGLDDGLEYHWTMRFYKLMSTSALVGSMVPRFQDARALDENDTHVVWTGAVSEADVTHFLRRPIVQPTKQFEV